MLDKKKILRAVPIAIGVVVLVLGLLYYYQQQGILKIFPTSEDRENKRILQIDESKFSPPEGLSQEDYQKEIAELRIRRQRVLDNPKDADAWFKFGFTKDFLNDHAGSAAAWEKAYELQPLNFVTAGNLANVYQYFLKDLPRAEYYYQQALAVRPDLTVAYQGLMDLYRYNWKEKSDKYEPTVLTAIEQDPQNKPGYLAALVEFFASNNDTPKAKEYLKQVQAADAKAAAELLEAYPALR